MVEKQSHPVERFGDFDQSSMEAFVKFIPDLEDLAAARVKNERYVRFDRLLSDLHRMLYDKAWVVAFDWSSWAHGEEGEKIFRTDCGIEYANLDQLTKAITSIARAERFQEHLFSNCVYNGTFLRIAKRVEQLLQDSKLSV